MKQLRRVARGEGDARSDIDILIDLDPEARLGVYEYVGVKDYIAGLLDRPVHVVNRKGLRPYLRQAVLADAVDIF